MLTFDEARKIAEENAETNLVAFREDNNVPLLREEYMETEHAWLFFRNLDIEIPNIHSLSGDSSYAISKKGEVRLFYDLPDKNKMQEAFEVLSAHFNDKGL